MMTHDESILEAERILLEAGWRPSPAWGRFCQGSLVAGEQPDGAGFHIKDWAKIPPGHPQYSVDTPDEPHEAAAWLIKRFAPQPVTQAPDPIPSNLELWEPPAKEGADMAQPININVQGATVNIGDVLARSGDARQDSAHTGGADEGNSEAVQETASDANAGIGQDPSGERDNRSGDGKQEVSVLLHSAELALTDVQHPQSEAVSETDPAPPQSAVDSGDEDPAAESVGSPKDGADSGGGDLLADDGSLEPGDRDEDILDAEYVDTADDRDPLALPPPGAVEGADMDELFDDSINPPELGPPEPEDFAGEPIEPVSEGVAIFGDNLADMRIFTQGRIADYAATQLAYLDASWDDAEYQRVTDYVVTRLEKHTGAFLGQTDEERRMYQVFLNLEAIKSYRQAIERTRDEKQRFIREEATREEVENYVVEEGWP